MVERAKKINKSVTFTPEAADQSLLEAIEEELTKQEYKTFSDLCKQALLEFLIPSETASSPPNFNPLASQIIELQRQFAAFEQRVSAQESHRLDQLEHQLSQLSEQMEQLEAKINQPQERPEPEAVLPVPVREVDPMISRLSQLLEDF